MSIKLMFVGDVHLSDRPPSTRTEEYANQILRKLVEVGQLAVAQDVDAIIYAGDIFHSKIPNRTSHALVRKVIKVFQWQRDRVPWVLVVPGNHDYAGANPEGLLRSPLGAVAQSGAIELLGLPDDPIVNLDLGPSLVVPIEGVREEEPLSRFGDTTARIVVAHSAIFPPQDEPPYDHFPAPHVASEMSGSGLRVLLYGHIHEPHGAYQVGETWFCNPGSLSRGSLHDADPYRTPQVVVVTIDGTRSPFFHFIDLKSARPGEEVFRIEEVSADREADKAAAEWAEELVQTRLEAFSIERVIEDLRSHTEVSSEVRERAVELIEGVG